MKMRRGKLSSFAISIAVLLTFQQQDAVYGSSTVAPGPVVNSSSSATPAINPGPMTTTSSPMPTRSAIVATPTTAASTSGTSSSSETTATSTTGTTSSSSVAIAQSTATPRSEKTCAKVTATLKESIPIENVTQILRHSLFIESKFREPNITILKTDLKEVTFSVCVNVIFNGEVQSDIERLVKKLLNATGVTFEISGVEITGWKAVDGECDKCSGGGGGPIKIRGSCKPKKEHYSCKGVKVEMETKDCSKYCSGVVSFMVSYLLVSMGIALSLSFYL